ncbi:arginine--tRNA ligase, putative [Plasmodium vinckei]|uniref:Arginine--tRNA ligase, putative n=1 Tax=Plasmodium vinckei TaxID=5860 RepID=A0A6V7SUM9_PLAVN|nr:arginine--tRNA ligase, putative [Plasmodium vinckei]
MNRWVFMVWLGFFFLEGFKFKKVSHILNDSNYLYNQTNNKNKYINAYLEINKIIPLRKWKNKQKKIHSLNTHLYSSLYSNPHSDIKKETSIYEIINNGIKNVAKKIKKNENLMIPKQYLLEDNKLYDDYEYQSGIVMYIDRDFLDGIPTNVDENKREDFRRKIIEGLKDECADIIDDILLSSNGILNIRVKEEYIKTKFYEFHTQLNENKPNYQTKNNEKQNIVLDYCGVNMAKHMHVGHLKSLFLGHALSNIFDYFNFNVNSRNHIGNWNANIAMVITFYIFFLSENWCNKFFINSSGLSQNSENLKMDNNCSTDIFAEQNENLQIVKKYLDILNNLKEDNFYDYYEKFNMNELENVNLDNIDKAYKISKQLYSMSPLFQNCAKHVLSLMYKYDDKAMQLWNALCSKTKKENDEILRKFKVHKLIEKGEDFYVKYVPKVLEEMEKRNILFKFGNKLCVLFKKKKKEEILEIEKMKINNYDNDDKDYYEVVQVQDKIYDDLKNGDMNVLKENYHILTLKNDIAYTYAGIDLAAIYYRVHFEKADKIIYVVDENQKNHFMQIFSIYKNMNMFSKNVECKCICYGFVLNNEKKKIKTKSFANNIFVKDVIQNLEKLEEIEIKKNDENGYSENVDKNKEEKIMYNKKYYTNKNHKDLLLSSIVYSYISVKNCKRQAINNLINPYNFEYIYIINNYNDIYFILRNLQKSNYSFVFEEKYNINMDYQLKKLLLDIMNFKNVLKNVIYNYNVDKLCSYLFSLSQKIHHFTRDSFNKNFLHYFEEKNVHKFLNFIKNISKEKIANTTTNAEKQQHGILDDEKEAYLNLFINFIKNDKDNNPIISKINSLSKDELNKIVSFFLNKTLEIIAMQSYLFIVSKIFDILNLYLVKFDTPENY